MDEENDETSSLSYPSHYYGWKKKKKIKICPSPSIWPSYSTPFGPLLKISIVAFISLLCSVGLTTAEKNKHCKNNIFYIYCILLYLSPFCMLSIPLLRSRLSMFY